MPVNGRKLEERTPFNPDNDGYISIYDRVERGNKRLLWSSIKQVKDRFDGIVVKTGNFTVEGDHAGYLVNVNSANTVTATIPSHTTEAIPLYSIFTLQQVGAGIINVVGASGVTVAGVGTASWDQYCFIQLLKEGENLWKVIGGE